MSRVFSVEDVASLIPKHLKRLTPYQAGGFIETIKARYNLDRVVKLASNENPYGCSPLAIKAIEGSLDSIARYPDSQAIALREQLAEKVGTHRDNVVVGNGSEGLLASVTRVFLQPDDEVVTSDGAFLGFSILCRAQGVEPTYVPLKNYRFDLEAIGQAITPRTKLVYLCNPNNPTATVFSREEFDRFVQALPSRVLVIYDEAYFEFAQEARGYPNSLDYRYDNTLTLRTFSKAYGLAGLRIGYGYGPKELIEVLWKVKLPFEPSSLSQAAALAALEDTEFLDSCVTKNSIERKRVFEGLCSLGLEPVPSATNFIMVPSPSVEYCEHVCHGLLTRGVLVRNLAPANLPYCWRVSLGLPEENDFFLEQLEHVLQSLA